MSIKPRELDIYDDDYWRGFDGIMERRQPYFASMRYLAELSRQLSRQADEEYERRVVAESKADREFREERERELRRLVIAANSTVDSTEADALWTAVDAMVLLDD